MCVLGATEGSPDGLVLDFPVSLPAEERIKVVELSETSPLFEEGLGPRGGG